MFKKYLRMFRRVRARYGMNVAYFYFKAYVTRLIIFDVRGVIARVDYGRCWHVIKSDYLQHLTL